MSFSWGIFKSAMRCFWLVRAHGSVDRGEELRRKVDELTVGWGFRVTVIDTLIFSEKRKKGLEDVSRDS